MLYEKIKNFLLLREREQNEMLPGICEGPFMNTNLNNRR